MPQLLLVTPETPAEHARNALTILSLLEQQAPAFWANVPELERAVRCADHAVSLLEMGVRAPFAVPHLEAAVRALSDAPVAWEVCPDVGAACARLIQAYFGAIRQ